MSTILIIEDEPDLREVLEFNLRHAGHDVLTGARADEGTRIVGNIIDVDPSDVRIGLRVVVDFVEDERGRKLPQWRPA